MTQFTNEETNRFTLNAQQLFERLVKLETDKLTIAADRKQLMDDAKYDEDHNPKGVDKDEIKLIAKAAILHAKNAFEETKEAADAVFEKYKELVNY